MKYRVGRKQKRVILDENGHEVAICHKGKEEVAQQICDLLNEHGLVSKNESLRVVSHCPLCNSYNLHQYKLHHIHCKDCKENFDKSCD